MKKEEIYLDLRNLSKQEKEHVFSLLPVEHGINYKITSIDYYLKVSFDKDKRWIVFHDVSGLKEVNYKQFLTLFETQLKIGDTFEYNGFVCEVKEEIKKWNKIEDNKNNKVAFEKLCKQDILDIEKLPYAKLTEITNKEFIKQLEENALS